MKLHVSEIFYSIQGEGGRAGHPSTFIRLRGCSAQEHCYNSGVRCDTDFLTSKKMSLLEIENWIKDNSNNCRWIVWTGGEPLDQLTSECITYFKELGFYQAIETSGVKPPLEGLDYICLSPKLAEHVILKNFKIREDGSHVDELRWVRHTGQSTPKTKIKSQRYFISPHFDGIQPSHKNISHCVKMCLESPIWNLSIQMHKLIGAL